MQRPSETDAEHAERLKETFCFTKSNTAFVGFPETLPSASPNGGLLHA